jgi:hypothetical protein
MSEYERTRPPRVFAPAAVPATDRQISYLEALRDGKDTSSLSPEQRAWLADVDFKMVGLSKTKASVVIATLVELPWAEKDEAQKVADDMPQVPDGRYAIPKDDGTLMFYSVKKGKYTTFVDVWASDARYPIKNAVEKTRILTLIKDDPDAGPRFGREIGKCYVCGRTLTDETSRELGIGPVCRAGGGGHD